MERSSSNSSLHEEQATLLGCQGRSVDQSAINNCGSYCTSEREEEPATANEARIRSRAASFPHLYCILTHQDDNEGTLVLSFPRVADMSISKSVELLLSGVSEEVHLTQSQCTKVVLDADSRRGAPLSRIPCHSASLLPATPWERVDLERLPTP
jgi:hypothetical protein